MDECIDSLMSAKIFSTLNYDSGYWQTPIAENDRNKTAFICHSRLYRFIQMPFGLKNAPVSFQSTLEMFCFRKKWKKCLVYRDDIIFFFDDMKDRFNHVRNILKILRGAAVSLIFAKCKFSPRKCST